MTKIERCLSDRYWVSAMGTPWNLARERDDVEDFSMVLSGLEQGIICTSNMSGEMHMRRRRDAKVRYSAAYPTGAERNDVNSVVLIEVV